MLLDMFVKKNKPQEVPASSQCTSEDEITETLASELRTQTWLKDATECVAKVTSNDLDDKDLVRYIKFIILSLVREMQAFYLYRTNIQQDISLRDMLYFPYASEQKKREETFILDEETVIACPWSLSRLLDSMDDVERCGYDSECETTSGTLFKELGLVIITNHNHHPAAAVYEGATKKMVVTGPVISLTDMEEDIYITEDFHFAAADGTPLEKNSDPRFVLATYLGQILGRRNR